MDWFQNQLQSQQTEIAELRNSNAQLVHQLQEQKIKKNEELVVVLHANNRHSNHIWSLCRHVQGQPPEIQAMQ
jgi:hypothetical protein